MLLSSVYTLFPTQVSCYRLLEEIRWQNVAICPYCGSAKKSSYKSEPRYHCNNCNTSYSVSVSTIFHRSRCDLQKWFLAIILIKSGEVVSARSLARYLFIAKHTGLLMMKKIKNANQENIQLMHKINKRMLIMGSTKL
jgi:transposase-like protein